MKKKKLLIWLCLLAVAAMLSWPGDQAGAAVVVPPGAAGFNPNVNYNVPNFAYSPNIRKFINGLPGLGAAGCALGNPLGTGTCNENNLGQYIPVAVPDTVTFPDADYYVIGATQYSLKLHSDLPATTLRGYRQENATDPRIQNVNQYLGPLIIGRSYNPDKPMGVNGNGKPIRILFKNELPTGPAGNLFLPVDTTLMGAGMGQVLGQNYTQNRVSIPHLHGGATPWISDGTPFQWITPANEPLTFGNPLYQKGASFQNVPDMIGAGKPIPNPVPSDGMGTLFWSNQQSARLMFYHDHAQGITRLNVYAGVAAGMLLTDQVGDDMIHGTNVSGAFTTPKAVLPNLGGVYTYGIPLVIQDRTFVNDATTPPGAGFTGTTTPLTATVDPLWYNAAHTWIGGTGVIPAGGSLWYPHEVMPNEDIYDPSGANPLGRWDYGPWLNPATIPINPNLPSPSITPEFFADTMMVNGTPYPYVTLPPTAVRFQILNACDDRSLNLSFFLADPTSPNQAEVRIVPAAAVAGYPANWPADGRVGGTVNPADAGPPWIQIANEGGLLPQVAVINPQPVTFEYSRLVPTFGNVLNQSLLLMPAMRADVVVDFSGFAGKTLILYNDAPAPMPLYDDRYDLSTGKDSFVTTGGAPTTTAGFGPNTRTVMQIRVTNTAPSPAFDLASLQAALPQAYKATQAPPIVPQAAYNAAFGTAYKDLFVRNTDNSLNLTGTPQAVNKVRTVIGGSGYTTPPTVRFVTADGSGSGAAATAYLNGVTGGITVTAGGSLYTLPPVVAITPAVGDVTGTGATAFSSISGGLVTAITVDQPGHNYTLNPTVTLTRAAGDTTGTGATAAALISTGVVSDILVTLPGAGYTRAPFVYLSGGGGTGANADAMLVGDVPIDMKNLTEGFDPFYGRMNLQLGTTPVPLNPTAQAPQVAGIAFYIDPPSDFWYDNKVQIFRLAHLGVDSHPIHFHLANLQIVNRVDATNTIMAPDANEVGWRETIRTNPFTDVILAVQPKSMVLPFAIPRSSRYLDPTCPPNQTCNWVQPAPIPGTPTPAGITNVLTDYNWEYVWHCHILGHEEFDGMRPIVFNPILMNTPTAPNPPLIPTPRPHLAGVLNLGVYKNPAVTFTRGIIANPPAGTLHYRFSTNDGTTTTLRRDYATGTTWAMPANTLTAGAYTLIVDARISTVATDPPDATGVLDFYVIPPVATGLTLTPSVASGTSAGPITFTALGSGSANYQYRFSVNGSVVQDYSTTATFTLPALTPANTYSISVDVRTNIMTATPDRTQSIAAYAVLAPTSLMYADFSSGLSGIYQSGGTAPAQINASQAQSMAAANGLLYASFAGTGISEWNGTTWTPINPATSINMVASGSSLYASVAGNGLWQWNGSAFNKIGTGNPVIMVVSGTDLYSSYTGQGLWHWNGSSWSQIGSGDPASMVVSGANLYADYTGQGLWHWNGSSWTKIGTGDPANMIVSGSLLYADYTGQGVWLWNGSAWTQLTTADPTIMVPGL